jgi:hypothetical protein
LASISKSVYSGIVYILFVIGFGWIGGPDQMDFDINNYTYYSNISGINKCNIKGFGQ